MTERVRRERRPLTVVVEQLEGAPVDVDAWAADLVELAMEVEGMKPAATTPPPVRSVG